MSAQLGSTLRPGILGKPERAFGNISAESEEILERLNGRKNILFLDISGK
mgnify:CR=1 FL=1